MQPGLSRAIPMGIIGFLVGALIVLVVRYLQNLTPLWAVGPGLVLSSIMCAVFFVWGIGAFDPKLSLHGEAAEAHPVEPDAEDKPANVLFGSIWQLSTLLLIGSLILLAVALVPGGPTLTLTRDPLASTTGFGFFDVQIGDQTYQVSELAVFMGFFIWMMISLAIAAGLIGRVMFALSQGVAEAKAEAAGKAPVATLPASEPRPAWQSTVIFIASFVVLVVVIFALFYFVLIGLVIPTQPTLNFILSAVQAVIVAILILRPRVILRIVGRLAALAAHILRGGNRVDGTQKRDLTIRK